MPGKKSRTPKHASEKKDELAELLSEAQRGDVVRDNQQNQEKCQARARRAIAGCRIAKIYETDEGPEDVAERWIEEQSFRR